MKVRGQASRLEDHIAGIFGIVRGANWSSMNERLSGTGGAAPVISVIMANFRGAAHLRQAVASCLAQSETRLEVLIADDASDDDSVAIADAMAREDPRVRVLPGDVNAGPGAARNRAILAAQGDWIAIVDSDDVIHPDRLSRLMAAAKISDADLIADDMVHFGVAEGRGGRTLLQPLKLSAARELNVVHLLQGNAGLAGMPALGYLKPVIRRSVLKEHRYNPKLPVGEDFDLILRLVLDGARYVIVPDPLYAYRRHSGSVSYRLSVSKVQQMLDAHRALPPVTGPYARYLVRYIDRQLRRGLRYQRMVGAIKARAWARVLPLLIDPAMLMRLAASLTDRRRRKRISEQSTSPVVWGAISPLPDAGAAWPAPPAADAARIADSRTGMPDLSAPEWAIWLHNATRPPGQV